MNRPQEQAGKAANCILISNLLVSPAELRPKFKGLFSPFRLLGFQIFLPWKPRFLSSRQHMVLCFDYFLLLFTPIPASGVSMYCKTLRSFSFLIHVQNIVLHFPQKHLSTLQSKFQMGGNMSNFWMLSYCQHSQIYHGS